MRAYKPLKSWQRSFIYLAAWLIVVVGLRLLTDDLIGSLILHIAYMMLLLPAATICIAFIYSRRGGLNPWLPCYMAAAVFILYFGFGYDALSPDFLVINLLCGFFGFGIGNIFKDEGAAKAQYETDHERKIKKAAEESRYQTLIDTDPRTGKKANLKKKNTEGQDR